MRSVARPSRLTGHRRRRPAQAGRRSDGIDKLIRCARLSIRHEVQHLDDRHALSQVLIALGDALTYEQ